MKKHFFYITYLLAFTATLPAQADNVPWQNPQINEINREPMHAHFLPSSMKMQHWHNKLFPIYNVSKSMPVPSAASH